MLNLTVLARARLIRTGSHETNLWLWRQKLARLVPATTFPN